MMRHSCTSGNPTSSRHSQTRRTSDFVGLSGTPRNGPKPVTTKRHVGRRGVAVVAIVVIVIADAGTPSLPPAVGSPEVGFIAN